MSDPFWNAAAGWAGQTALAGGGVLLIAWLWSKLTRSASRRQMVGAWAMRGAVLSAALCLLPAWVILPAVSREAKPSVAPATALPEPVEFVAAEPTTEIIDDDWAPAAIGEDPIPAPRNAASVPPAEANRSLAVAALESPPEPVKSFDLLPLLLMVYAVVAIGLGLQLVAGHVALLRLRRCASPAPPRVRAVLESLAAGEVAPAVLVSDLAPSPVCFGLVRPTILLPRSLAATASADELRWVLAHELDHLRRGDPWTAAWVGVCRAVFFYVPWFWAVRRDVALAQEYLADAAAAAAGGEPADYAEFLVTLSGGSPRRPTRSQLASIGARAGESDLFRRVSMLLSAKTPDRRPSRGWVLLSASGLLSAAVVMSGLGWASADEDNPKPRVEKKERPRDGDAPRPGPRDGDAPKPGVREGERPMPPDLEELRKKMRAAIEKKDLKEIEKLLEQIGPPRFGPRAEGRPEGGRPEGGRPEGGRPEGRPGPGGPPGREGRPGEERRPRLGVTVERLEGPLAEQLNLPKGVGLLVTDVAKDTPADKAGVKKNDILVKFGGKDVPGEEEKFVEVVSKSGGKAEVVVLRKGSKETLAVVFAPEKKPEETTKRPQGRGGKPEFAPPGFPGLSRGPAGGEFSKVALEVEDESFRVKGTKDKVEFTVSGSIEKGRPVATMILVKDGSETTKVESVEKLSDKHRPLVRQLLGYVGGSPGGFPGFPGGPGGFGGGRGPFTPKPR